MRYSILATLTAGLATLAAAQLDLPDCSLPCFEEAIGNTTCGLTDYYCQCTTGAQVIQSQAISCLCLSDCTTSELLQVVQDSNKICSSAVSASSQTYVAETVGLDVCAAAATSSTGTGTVASTSATATGDSSSSSGSSGTATAASSSAGSSSTSTSTTSSSGANSMVVYEGAVIGFAGLVALLL
ncbi:hypothetical protein LTR36_006637 [Oleoguttula mirabilis]|uniref:CFEM domain-containing protein n=1 Tax=Oleoguttula mirabilis TaxID=1507867 RepID=A0AAV9JBV4_9PEZI|nr:hypothetical protein LTR36_006637 [Oleoguttula mirabilis]